MAGLGAESDLDAPSSQWKGWYLQCCLLWSLQLHSVQCQLLCRVAPESRGLCRSRRLTGWEDSSEFRNDLSFLHTLFSCWIPVKWHSWPGRNWAGDRDGNSGSPEGGGCPFNSHLCPGQWVSGTPLDDAMSHKANVYFSWKSSQKVMIVKKSFCVSGNSVPNPEKRKHFQILKVPVGFVAKMLTAIFICSLTS